MYYYLNGELTLRDTNFCVIECAGVGYKLTTSMKTAESLATKVGQNIKLYTYLAIREDDIELFGFSSIEERNAFNMLISVNGVGPKAAVNILSIMSADNLAHAICSDDIKSISKAQNVGTKTAARIVLELKDKISKDVIDSHKSDPGLGNVGNVAHASSSSMSDAADALMGLGYDKVSVTKVLSGISPDLDVGSIIKAALKKLAM